MSILRIVNITFPMLAALSGFYSIKKLDKPFRIVLTMVCIGFITEILLWVAKISGSKNTLTGLHFYIMVEFMFWALFYMYQLEGFIKKRYILFIIVVFEISCILNTIFLQKLTEFPQTRSIEGLIIILFSILVFYRFLIEESIEKLLLTPIIWVNTVVLFYFTGNFFFNIFFTIMLKQNYEVLKFASMYIYSSFNAIFYSGIAVGFLIQNFNSVHRANAKTIEKRK